MKDIQKEDLLRFLDFLPIIIALSMSLFWVFNGSLVTSNPYLLGIFRGFIWPTLIFTHFKLWVKHIF